MSTEKKQPVILLDKEFRDELDANTEAGWLEYCKLHGISPDKPNNQESNNNGGTDR